MQIAINQVFPAELVSRLLSSNRKKIPMMSCGGPNHSTHFIEKLRESKFFGDYFDAMRFTFFDQGVLAAASWRLVARGNLAIAVAKTALCFLLGAFLSCTFVLSFHHVKVWAVIGWLFGLQAVGRMWGCPPKISSW